MLNFLQKCCVFSFILFLNKYYILYPLLLQFPAPPFLPHSLSLFHGFFFYKYCFIYTCNYIYEYNLYSAIHFLLDDQLEAHPCGRFILPFCSCSLPIPLHLGVGACGFSPIHSWLSTGVELFRSSLGSRILEISWVQLPCQVYKTQCSSNFLVLGLES